MVKADEKNEFKYEALFYGIEEVKPEYRQNCEEKNIKWHFAKKVRKLDIGFYKQIFRSIRSSNPDIIFLHGSSYIWLSKIYTLFSTKKCRIIVRETQANHLKTFLQSFWTFWSLLLADKIVFLSDQYKLQLKNKFRIFFNNKKTVVIPNGIDIELYQTKSKTTSSNMLIGMQSRIVKIKDHTTLLKAFKILKDSEIFNKYNIKLKIAGDGTYKHTLINLSKGLHIDTDVEFVGNLSEKILIQFLHSLDIYVHASLGETMSTAIMQAMASGLPIIASDVPGINNMIINNITGLLVEAGDEVQMAACLQNYIVNKQLRTTIGLNALTFAQKHYSNKIMFKEYKKIFAR